MKIEVTPKLYPKRGGEVKVGNVYEGKGAKRFVRVVISMGEKTEARRAWNNCVCIHVDLHGEIVGCSNQPQKYMQDHQDLIGRVKEMPSMKIEWLQENER